MKTPFSTLLILSFTLATSTLVLRGTLVLVRRILNSGTLQVKQKDQRVHTYVLFWSSMKITVHLFLSVYTLVKSNSKSVNQCQYLLSGIIFPAKNLSMPPTYRDR